MDRLESIKQIFEEADAAGQISADSSTRWLIAEVERLRRELRHRANTDAVIFDEIRVERDYNG